MLFSSHLDGTLFHPKLPIHCCTIPWGTASNTVTLLLGRHHYQYASRHKIECSICTRTPLPLRTFPPVYGPQYSRHPLFIFFPPLLPPSPSLPFCYLYPLGWEDTPTSGVYPGHCPRKSGSPVFLPLSLPLSPSPSRCVIWRRD